MATRSYHRSDRVEVRAGSFAGRCGTVLQQVVDQDAQPLHTLCQVQFPDEPVARWFVAGRLRKARS